MTLPDSITSIVQLDPKSKTLSTHTQPVPTAKPGFYLVRVHAACPCLGEREWESDSPEFYETSERPRVLGIEGAGTIVSGTPGGEHEAAVEFKPGDKVFWTTDAPAPGALRAYTTVRADYLAHAPAHLSWPETAAVPLSSTTAWQTLFDHGSLDPAAVDGSSNAAEARAKNANVRVLVTGAAGSVGLWAIRLAAAAGAKTVVGVCSGAKADIAREAGATQVIDYTTSKTAVKDWAEQSADNRVDLIIDCFGGKANLAALWYAIAPGGSFISIAGDVGEPADARPEGITTELKAAKWVLFEPRGSELESIAKLVGDKGWKILVDSVFPLDKFAEAYDKVEGGRTKGKVVIEIGEA